MSDLLVQGLHIQIPSEDRRVIGVGSDSSQCVWSVYLNSNVSKQDVCLAEYFYECPEPFLVTGRSKRVGDSWNRFTLVFSVATFVLGNSLF